jgi:hypothetical protein
MTHFKTLVITDNGTEEELFAALQPFHEFESTQIVDEYVRSVDSTEEIRADWQTATTELSFREYILDEYDRLPILKGEPDLYGEHKQGWIVDKNELLSVITRTNPNRKWDWWVVGGRWSNSLLTKSGIEVNSAQKQHINFNRMLAMAAGTATGQWYEFHQQFAVEIADFIPWKTVRESWDDVEEARAFYHDQSLVRALRESRVYAKLNLDLDLSDVVLPLEKYVETYVSKNIGHMAVVKDKVWCERAKVGWFGATSENFADWIRQTEQSLIDATLPTQWLTVVDCHI